MESLKLEKFKAKESNLSSVYGGKGEPVQTSEKTYKDANGCTIHTTDGFIDENDNDKYDCGDSMYFTSTKKCCRVVEV